MHKRAVTNYGTTGNTNTSLSTMSPNYWSNSCRPVDPNVSPTCFVAQITVETSTVNRWSLKTVFSPSLFMPASMHLRSRQARHWFRCILSTAHVSGWPRDLQSYFRPLRTDRWQFTISKTGASQSELCWQNDGFRRQSAHSAWVTSTDVVLLALSASQSTT